MPAIRIEIEGRVQGVGFRAFVCRRAALFGVGGSVWNRSDGLVEVFAVYPELSVLEAFAESFKSGPGKVQGVRTFPAEEPEIEPLGFSTSPSR